MRRVQLSQTFIAQFDNLLEQGYPQFGERVVLEKRERVFRLIEDHLAHYPRMPRSADHGLCVYPVRGTPFVLIYDFDDAELRIYGIFHGRADLGPFDPGSVDW